MELLFSSIKMNDPEWWDEVLENHPPNDFLIK